MPHAKTDTCEQCNAVDDLFFCRTVNQYLCNECVMAQARSYLDKRKADRIDGFDRDDLGESPDY